MRRLLLTLGLIGLGMAGAADMPKQGAVAWQRLLIATRGEEMSCPHTVSFKVHCAVAPGMERDFRSMVSLQPHLRQVQEWRYDTRNESYSGVFRIDSQNYRLAVTPFGGHLLVALYSTAVHLGQMVPSSRPAPTKEVSP